MASSAPVLTLRDLDRWPASGVSLAVLGHPIHHSLSPVMHHAALAAMARTRPEFSAWRYDRFDVPPADLPEALARFHAAGFRGLNLTVPHKVLALAHVAAVSAGAQAAGAVNTLRWTPAGWEGHNTDGHGLAAGLRADLALALTDRPVLLLGAGGAARGAAVECLAQRCASLWIANRTTANLDALLAQLRPLAGEIPLRGFAPDAPPADLPAGLIVINATSAGLRADDPAPIDLTRVPRAAGVYDMIYNPPQTPLLRAAAAQGIPSANGLSMLAHQGARALEIWSDAAVPVEAMLAAARAALTG
jgi:shikimate dehydrogenase